MNLTRIVALSEELTKNLKEFQLEINKVFDQKEVANPHKKEALSETQTRKKNKNLKRDLLRFLAQHPRRGFKMSDFRTRFGFEYETVKKQIEYFVASREVEKVGNAYRLSREGKKLNKPKPTSSPIPASRMLSDGKGSSKTDEIVKEEMLKFTNDMGPITRSAIIKNSQVEWYRGVTLLTQLCKEKLLKEVKIMKADARNRVQPREYVAPYSYRTAN